MKDVIGLGTILLWQWLTVLKGPLFPSLVDIPLLGPEGGFALFSLILFATFLLLALKGKDLPEAWFVRAVRLAPILMSAAWLPWGWRGASLPAPLLLFALVLPPFGSAVHLAS